MPRVVDKVFLLNEPGAVVEDEIEYDFYFDFGTDDAAPVTDPLVGEVGSLDIVQTGNTQSTSGGVHIINGFTSAGDPAAMTVDSYARAVGRTMRIDVRFPANAAVVRGGCGWDGNALPTTNFAVGMTDNGGTGNFRNAGNAVALHSTLAPDTDYKLWFRLRAAGSDIFREVGGSPFLEWPDDNGTTTPFYAGASSKSTACKVNMSTLRSTVLGGNFATEKGHADFDVSTPVNGAVQTGAANGIYDFEYAVPGSPANGNVIGMIFRRTDASNYWIARIVRAAGQWNFELVEVLAGVEQAASISVSNVLTTDTIRVLTNGTAIECYTRNGTTWSRRGTGITSTQNQSATGVAASFNAGTSQLLTGYSRTSSKFDLLATV